MIPRARSPTVSRCKIRLLTTPASGEYVHDAKDGTRREISAGDILVLVRTRNAFFAAVIRALKAHGVPVAGADRLDVANHIAVMDLVAAGRAALLPQDDLSLACVLKSPLFGFTDDDLILLAPGRKGALIAALAASAGGSTQGGAPNHLALVGPRGRRHAVRLLRRAARSRRRPLRDGSAARAGGA